MNSKIQLQSLTISLLLTIASGSNAFAARSQQEIAKVPQSAPSASTQTIASSTERARRDDETGEEPSKDIEARRLEHYTKAIQLNPKDVEAYINRGISYRFLGNNKRSIADLNKAISLQPNNSEAYYQRARTRRKMGDKKGAIADFTYVIKLGDKHNLDAAYLHRGDIQQEIGDDKGALDSYTQAIELYSKYENSFDDKKLSIPSRSKHGVYIDRGEVRTKIGDRGGAISDFTMAIEIFAGRLGELKPATDDTGFSESLDNIAGYSLNLARAYFGRGDARSKLGDKQAAIADFQKAAEIYQQKGDKAKTEKALQAIARLKG